MPLPDTFLPPCPSPGPVAGAGHPDSHCDLLTLSPSLYTGQLGAMGIAAARGRCGWKGTSQLLCSSAETRHSEAQPSCLSGFPRRPVLTVRPAPGSARPLSWFCSRPVSPPHFSSLASSNNLPDKPLTFNSLPQSSLRGEPRPTQMAKETCGQFLAKLQVPRILDHMDHMFC